jgi:hypothetical protein
MINKMITHLKNANLKGTDLRGVDISCADGITADQLRGAIIDETTMMPPGLEHLARECRPDCLAKRY